MVSPSPDTDSLTSKNPGKDSFPSVSSTAWKAFRNAEIFSLSIEFRGEVKGLSWEDNGKWTIHNLTGPSRLPGVITSRVSALKLMPTFTNIIVILYFRFVTIKKSGCKGYICKRFLYDKLVLQ